MFAPLPTASLRLSDLFSPPFLFRIPDFQRAYSWTVKEAGRLFDDLNGAAGIADPDLEEPDYFLGTILVLSDAVTVLPKPDATGTPQMFDIIDGQQRIVTLNILIAALRDALPGAATANRAALDRFIYSPPARTGSAPVSRLLLRDGEQAFFTEHVQRAGAGEAPLDDEKLTDGQRSLLIVRDHLRREIAALDPADRVRLAEYIAGRAHFVLILAQGIDRAHRLFEVLNERGKPLARNDILKAELLRMCSDAERAAVLEGWDQASRRLGSGFEELFGHIRAIKGYHRPQIIVGVRAVVRDTGGPEAFVRSTLIPCSQAFQAIQRPDAAEIALDRPLRDIVHQLGRLKGEEWAPPAMLALDINRGNPPAALSAIRALDRFAHLSRILNLVAHKRVKRTQAAIDPIADRVEFGPTQGSGLLQFTREELRVVGFNLRDIHRRNAGLAKLILLRIEDALSGNATRRDAATLSVEHVLPLRPSANSEWRRQFPDAEEREACTDCLGNLTLMAERHNHQIRNFEFDDKKNAYARAADGEAPFALTADILAAPNWNPAAVRQREAKLLRLIGDIWGVDYDHLIGA